MLKEKDKIKVHIYDTTKKEIKTRNHNKIFEVKKEVGQLGINWSNNSFNPFYTFFSNVIFENIETGKIYHFNNMINNIEELQP